MSPPFIVLAVHLLLCLLAVCTACTASTFNGVTLNSPTLQFGRQAYGVVNTTHVLLLQDASATCHSTFTLTPFNSTVSPSQITVIQFGALTGGCSPAEQSQNVAGAGAAALVLVDDLETPGLLRYLGGQTTTSTSTDIPVVTVSVTQAPFASWSAADSQLVLLLPHAVQLHSGDPNDWELLFHSTQVCITAAC